PGGEAAIAGAVGNPETRADGAFVEPDGEARADLRADHVRHRPAALAEDADDDEGHADAADRRDLRAVQLPRRQPSLPLAPQAPGACPAARRPPRKLTPRRWGSASNSSRSVPWARTATSFAGTRAPRRRQSSIRAAAPPSSG